MLVSFGLLLMKIVKCKIQLDMRFKYHKFKLLCLIVVFVFAIIVIVVTGVTLCLQLLELLFCLYVLPEKSDCPTDPL